ncbi:hypothetical protein KCU77_g2022, partial [Aureobasidium melanogenum]
MRSYRDHTRYPRNLIPELTKAYLWELERYDHKFADVRSSLCLESEEKIALSIRDLYSTLERGDEILACDIKTSLELQKHLEGSADPRDSTSKRQPGQYPKCRFICLYAAHSRARLRLTYDMLTRVLTFHQVMPGYLDFLHAFGAQDNPRAQFFAGFYQQTMLQNNAQIPKMIGYSWRQYQLCYNLRGVTCIKQFDGTVTEWSVRQAAIHHQFDVVYGTAVWVLTKGRQDLLEKIDQFTTHSAGPTFNTPQACFGTSLEVHRMFCHWAADDWRQYIDWLEDGLESNTSLALYGSQESKHSRETYVPRDLQEIQLWKEKTSQAATLLNSNADVMAALRAYYVKLLENEDFPLRTECQKNIQNFATDIESNIIWARMQISRLNLLAEIIDGRKDLVAQHFQNQVAERTEQLNHNLEKEAIVMRIITIVTLVYLPATFVSTFFSTDIVHYQASGDSGSETSYSHLAMMRWLQVTLPLTFVTILGAWMAFKTATISRKSAEMKNNLIKRKDNMKTTWGFSKDIELGKL